MRARSPVIVAALALAVLTSLAGHATASVYPVASTVEVDVAPLPSPVEPLTETVETTIEVTYTVQAGLAISQPTQVDLRVVELPAWAVATLSPSTLRFEPEPGVGSSETQEATLLVSVTADAPAFVPEALAVEAVALPNAPYAESSGTGSVPVQAGYMSILDVEVEPAILEAGAGEEVESMLTIQNHGNGPTRVAFTVEENEQALHVTLPDPVVVHARQTGNTDTALTVPVAVRAPADGLTGPALLKLRATGSYALDGELEGDEATLSLLVEPPGDGSMSVHGASGGLDAPAPAFAAFAVAVLAAARWRRRV